MKPIVLSNPTTTSPRTLITLVTPQERNRVLREIIDNRASQFCARSECRENQQGEYRPRAQSKTVLPLNCDYLLCDDGIDVTIDAAPYAGNEIKICAEPRMLMLYGNEHFRTGTTHQNEDGPTSVDDRLIFRFLELPIEIDPSQVSARLKGETLKIALPKAFTKSMTPTAGDDTCENGFFIEKQVG